MVKWITNIQFLAKKTFVVISKCFIQKKSFEFLIFYMVIYYFQMLLKVKYHTICWIYYPVIFLGGIKPLNYLKNKKKKTNY